MNDQPAAVILAGGQSRRMGTDKALLRMRPGGPTLVEAVVARLREAGMEPALLVTNNPEAHAFLGLPMCGDDVPGAGPLGGILTALTHISRERALVVACDMPLLNPALLRYMVSLPATHDVIIPRWTYPSGEERLETLHALYSRRCIEPVRARIEARRLKVAAFLADISAYYIEEDELRRVDPKLESFRNVNTPEEWAELAGQEE